jgi:DNA sulfur modification protein DndD
MIIKKIELENFMCYSGNNVFEFTEGINVVIGDNGYGKSQLYNAFYWVMYDQIFVKARDRFAYSKEVKLELISDKALHNSRNEKIYAKVAITFHNPLNDNEFILERKFGCKCSKDSKTPDNDSEFTVQKKDLSYLNAKLVTDEIEKNRIRDKILPSDIKPYLWFQGEQVESIIDFNKQDTLTRAINVLSSIKRYDQLKLIASAAAKAGNADYDRAIRKLSKDLNLSDSLEKRKKSIETEIDQLLADEIEYKENLSKAEEKSESLLGKLGDATKISEIKQNQKSLLNELNNLNQSLQEEQTSFHRKMFRNKWVLKGTSFLHEEFSKKYSIYESNKLQKLADAKAKRDLEAEIENKLQSRLPLDVPEPIYVQKMLEDERCLVCDREAKKNSEAWNKIKQLIQRPRAEESSPKIVISVQNFSEDLKKLYQGGLALTHRINDIELDITETLERINGISIKIRSVNNEIEKLESELRKITSDSAQSSNDAESIVAEFGIQNKYVKEFTEKVNLIAQKLDFNRKSLDEVNDQLKDLVTGEIPKWLIEKKQVLNDFDQIASSTRDRVFSKLITQLETEANEHYSAMTSGNKSSRGQIKLRKLPNGNYMPEIVDLNGSPLSGFSTGNIILVKLATIMAILSAKSNDGTVSFYTLITDAPTSVFGEDYTIGFCKTVSKVYKQSIVMSKEFYKNQKLRSELLTNPHISVGKVYLITPSISEAERSDRTNLSTNIELLN